MSEPVYVDQSAVELRLTVCKDSLNFDQFNLLEVRERWCGGIFVQAAIIGASHVLRFTTTDGEALNEVFACMDVATSGRPLLVAKSLPRDQVKFDLGGLTYNFDSEVRTGDSALDKLGQLQLDIGIAKNSVREIGLSHDFPKKSEDPWIPQTLIYVGPRQGGGAFARTAHSYPNENTIVFTETTVITERS